MISRGWTRVALVSASIAVIGGRAARAQGGVIVVGVDAGVPGRMNPGDHVVIPIVVDPSGAPGTKVASLSAQVHWPNDRLSLDSVRPTAFGTLTTTTAPGLASLSIFNTTGVTSKTTIANLYFTAALVTAGAPIQVVTTAAGDESGTNVLPLVRPHNVEMCVALFGVTGDATGDGIIDILDAQQLARVAVGFAPKNASATSSLGDVNQDGAIDILDAQQVGRFAVGVAVQGVGAPSSLLPAVASVTLGAPSSDVPLKQAVALVGVPQDANGVPLNGCAPLTWSTSAATTASVTSDGVVTGVASGTATIRAASANGKFATFDVHVYVPVGSVVFSRDTATIHMGEQLQLSASVVDASANRIPGRVITSASAQVTANDVSRAITYASSDVSIATVSSDGLVTGVTVGKATITASSQGVSSVATVQVAPLAENSLALGDSYSCALIVTGVPYCWGTNAVGQLGDGSGTNSNVPVAVAMPSAALRFTQIAAAAGGACGLSTQHSVYCWGNLSAAFGQFPNPTLISGNLRISAMDVWPGGICMLDLAGSAYCAGANATGQLGNGSTTSSVSPVPVSGGLTFQSISTGLEVNCGLSSGTAYCWGSNQLHSLGVVGNPAASLVPVPVAGGHTFTSVTAGASVSCGIEAGASGTAFCWGTDFNGSLGLGTLFTISDAPAAMFQGNIVFGLVRPGRGNDINTPSCGLTVDGTAYCWGANNAGQIGTTQTLPTTTCNIACTAFPTLVSTDARLFRTIRVGGEQVCGITVDHRILCWGANGAGQVGDGSNTNRGTPTLVSGGLRIP